MVIPFDYFFFLDFISSKTKDELAGSECLCCFKAFIIIVNTENKIISSMKQKRKTNTVIIYWQHVVWNNSKEMKEHGTDIIFS